MSSFSPDKNTWYQINKLTSGKVGTAFSMVATPLFSGEKATTGSAFFSNTDFAKEPGQKWNFFPVVGTASYALRTSRSPHVYLDIDEKNTPRMVNATLRTNGSLWEITSWADGTGTYYITNNAVGSDLHMLVNIDSQLSFGKKEVTLRDVQSFVFNQTAPLAINDVAYSSIDPIPIASSTSSSTSASITTSSSSTASSSSTTSPTQSSTIFSQGSSTTTTTPLSTSSQGLSSGAIGGIASAIIVVMLVALLGVGAYFWRRRRARRLASFEENTEENTTRPDKVGGSGGSEGERLVVKEAHELPVPMTELQGDGDNRWELPDNTAQTQRR